MGKIALLDHLDRLAGGRLDVVLQHRHAEFIGDRLNRRQVEGLGDRGDDPLEEEGFDDLGALDTEAVGQFLVLGVVNFLRTSDPGIPFNRGMVRPIRTLEEGAQRLRIGARQLL